MQRLLDLLPDLGKLNRRIHSDPIGNAGNAGEVVDGNLGFGLLEAPIDIASQGDNALLDLDGYPVSGKTDAPFEDVDRPSGNFVIRGFPVRGQANLDLLGDRLNVSDPSSGALGRH